MYSCTIWYKFHRKKITDNYKNDIQNTDWWYTKTHENFKNIYMLGESIDS